MAYTTIDDPTIYFNTKLYTGNNTGQSITGVGFQPDWVWIKSRTDTNSHNSWDSVRGVNKYIENDTTKIETTVTNGVTAFGTDGFTVGARDAINDNGLSLVSWNWKAGTSFSNDASSTGIGDIDSSGSVNTDAGFSIITATSDGAADKDIAHGLGAVPDVIFAKNLVRAYNWDCYFKTLGYNASLILNNTDAPRTGAWGSNTFTTTTFETKEDYSSKSGEAYIYYCFAEKKGYSKFGSYTGNGNADGTFVYTGFSPAFIIFKRTNTANDWFMVDNKINPFNVTDKMLRPNLSNVEQSFNTIDFLSNGFKPRGALDGFNASGSTYIYMAFAQSPFVTSTGIPTTAR